MNIFINPLSDKAAPVLQTKPSGSPILHMRFKRGSSVPLTMTLVGVTEAGNLRIGMKRRDRYESPLLAYAAAATPDEAEGSGETSPAGARFTLMLHERDECHMCPKDFWKPMNSGGGVDDTQGESWWFCNMQRDSGAAPPFVRLRYATA